MYVRILLQWSIHINCFIYVQYIVYLTYPIYNIYILQGKHTCLDVYLYFVAYLHVPKKTTSTTNKHISNIYILPSLLYVWHRTTVVFNVNTDTPITVSKYIQSNEWIHKKSVQGNDRYPKFEIPTHSKAILIIGPKPPRRSSSFRKSPCLLPRPSKIYLPTDFEWVAFMVSWFHRF